MASLNVIVELQLETGGCPACGECISSNGHIVTTWWGTGLPYLVGRTPQWSTSLPSNLLWLVRVEGVTRLSGPSGTPFDCCLLTATVVAGEQWEALGCKTCSMSLIPPPHRGTCACLYLTWPVVGGVDGLKTHTVTPMTCLLLHNNNINRLLYPFTATQSRPSLSYNFLHPLLCVKKLQGMCPTVGTVDWWGLGD